MKQRYIFLCLLLLLASGVYAQPALIPYRLYTKWGFADMTGKLVIPAKYDQATEYHGNCAIAKLNGKYGLIDSTGKQVLPFIYSGIEHEKWNNKIWFTLEAGKKSGLADQTGKLLLPAKYDELRLISEGPYAAAFTGGTYVKVKPDGTVEKAILADWQKLESLGERKISVEPYTAFAGPYTLNGKKGYLVKRLRPGYDSIPAIYDATDEINVYDNIMWVKKDSLWGVIGPKNNIIFPLLYEELGSVSVKYNLYSGKKNGKFGILKPNGDVLVPFEWDRLYFPLDQFWCIATKGDKDGIIILDGNEPVFIPARYKDVSPYPVTVIEHEGRKIRFFAVETPKGYGYVREDGMEYFKDAK
ncbi:WG repeat-containing protein [Chitinophaga niabensis]|uniref:WG repeat-containing protein n=1 Tax=Chitinophaga niabensis TaxID=536979 RepID=UPI0031BA2623